ncbi:CDP-glycerol--glycerophosphate glycerophosphotransferase [Campylobacter coli]|nr:CDP-glycerol--glycerophosphate glycerophosphotransferase [Campylobacter coli]
MFLKWCIFAKQMLFQSIYYFYYYLFSTKKILLIIYSNSSMLYSNLKELEECLKKQGVKYKVIFNTKSINNIKYIANSSIIIIDQSNYFLSYIKLFSSTKVLQLWHGGGLYKKVAFDKILSLESNKNIIRIYRNISFLNISDKKLVDDYSRMFNIHKENIINYGLPRTDRLFSRDTLKDKKEFLLMYPEIGSKKICLYAPTFREDTKWQPKLLNVDMEDMVKQLQGYVVIYRAHPTLKISDDIKDIIDVSNLELDFVLSIADILISDYSSIIFDYSFFKRPIVLYVPDLKEYFVKKKQLYFHPSELVGCSNVCYNSTELANVVKRATYEIDLWDLFMSNCKGNSCQQLVGFIKDLQIKGDT